MKKVGLVVKASNPEAIRLGKEVAEFVKAKGGEVYVEASLCDRITPSNCVTLKELAAEIDVMVVLGGDGTMLGAARQLDGRKVPILGINMGGLGFLTAATVKETFSLVERVLNDACETEERMMLSVELVRGGNVISHHKVLNDVVVKGENGRLVKLETRINKEYVTTYRADGLIIATPTGSTAYSLSAAGPILYPTIHSIIVVPICPFNLTNRPVVIPDWMTVEMTVRADSARVQLVLDGQVDVDIKAGDIVSVKRADAIVYLVKNENKSYFDILRERLMWEVKVAK